MPEARSLADRYRQHHSTVRPHSFLGYRPLAPEAFVPWPSAEELPAAQAELAL